MRGTRTWAIALAAFAILTACDGSRADRSADADPSVGDAPSGPVAEMDESSPGAEPAPVADENDLLSVAERLQANLDAILASSSRVSGSWFVGDVNAEFTVYYDGDTETYAEERVDRGDGGRSWRQYYFEAGELVFFVEEGSIPSADGAGGTDSVLVLLDFDSDGEVERFYKTIGGVRADLGESEPSQVWQSLARLREGARQAGP